MIVLWGLRSEGPIRQVLGELERLGEAVELLDQWNAFDMKVDLGVEGGLVGHVWNGDRRIDICEVTALYARPYDWRYLCVRRQLVQDEPAWRQIAQVEEALHAWWTVAEGIVVNPPCAMASNGSKPYQSSLIRAAGLSVPSTLVTTDAAAAQAFWELHGDVVYKSVSGVRSRVARLTAEHATRMTNVASCPTQFQEYIRGTDVRVHVIGDELFATEIATDATDYRYAAAEPRLRACSVPDDIRANCFSVTARLGLRMAGIDLRRTPDGQWFCFEVNPSPGFTYYESGTGQPLAAAAARLLADRHGVPPTTSKPIPTRVNLDPRATGLKDAARRVFIRSDERPEVGQAAVRELLESPSSLDCPTGART